MLNKNHIFLKVLKLGFYLYSISEFVEILQKVVNNQNKNFIKLSDLFLNEMENMQIKKNN